MGRYFAASTNGFYDEDVGGCLPNDAVPISDELHLQLLEGQSAGGRIQANAQGQPYLVMPSKSERWANVASRIRAERDRRMQMGVAIGGIWWPSDAFTRVRLTMLAAVERAPVQVIEPLGQAGQEVDGVKARSLVIAMLQHDSVLQAVADAHLDAALAAADPESYSFSDGWPSTFLDAA